MSITFQKCYVAQGKTYATIEQAQTAEIEAILREHSGALENVSIETVATTLVANAERVLDVLTTKDSSRPKARAVNGGRKPRKKNQPFAPDFVSPTQGERDSGGRLI